MPMRLLPVVGLVLLGMLTVGLPLPVLPRWVHEELGFNTVWVGIVVGTQSAATLLTRAFAGRLCDERGPRWAVLSGLGLCSAAGWAYVVAAAVPAPAGLPVLLAGRLVLGMGESLLMTGSLAWGIGRLGPAQTGKVMVWVGMALYTSFAGGAPLGVLLQQAFGYGGVALAAAVAPLLVVPVALLTPNVPVVGGTRLPFHAVAGRIWQPGAGLFLSALPYAGIVAFLPLALVQRGWGGAGLAMTSFGVGFIVARLLFGQLPDRRGARPVAAAMFVIEFVGQGMLAFAPGLPLALLGAALTGFGFSLVFPAMGIEAVRRVPPESRGAALGAYTASFDLALGFGGPALGVVADHAGLSAVFVAGMVSCVAGLLISLGLRPVSVPSAPDPAAAAGVPRAP